MSSKKGEAKASPFLLLIKRTAFLNQGQCVLKAHSLSRFPSENPPRTELEMGTVTLFLP